MKISIVTIVYNDASNIEKTINSVLNQTHQDIEYIIVDGASTDGTMDIVEKYSDRITKIISEPDSGVYDAMNKGINLAAGEYINFMNSGDWFADDNVLADVAAGLNEKTDYAYGHFYFVFPDRIEERISRDVKHLWKGMVFSHQSLFVRTEIMKKIKFDTKYKSAADFDFINKLCRGDYLGRQLDRFICYYTSGGISYSNQERSISECIDILSKYDIVEPYRLFWEDMLEQVRQAGLLSKVKNKAAGGLVKPKSLYDMGMKISVITVTLNAGEYIRQTLESVINQTCFDRVELVIVDGVSKDNTLNILKEYKDSIDAFVSESDTGIYNAMNKGVDLSTGDYVIFLNAGDTFAENDIVETVLKNATVSADMIYGDRYDVDGDGAASIKKAEGPDKLHIRESIFHQALFTSRGLIKEKFDESYRISADYEFTVRAHKSGADFLYISIPMVKFLTEGYSTSTHDTQFLNLLEALHILTSNGYKLNELLDSDFFSGMADFMVNRMADEKEKFVYPKKEYIKAAKERLINMEKALNRYK